MTPLEPLLRELLGEALRRRRRAQGRTLADVAAQAGMSMQHLSDVERGRKDPSSEMVAAICGALDLTLGQLMRDRKSTRLNSSHVASSYAVFCLKKKIQ